MDAGRNGRDVSVGCQPRESTPPMIGSEGLCIFYIRELASVFK